MICEDNKTPTPSQKDFTPGLAARWLESRGWRKDVAGESDFAAAIAALCEFYGDRTKGLLIMGVAGVGKTKLANIIRTGRSRAATIKINCGIESDVENLVFEADASLNNGNYSSAAPELLDMTVMIDDLGAETVAKIYGTEFNRVGRFITRYYGRGRYRLLMTTNLTIDELIDKYGQRVVDRIMDRCVVLRLNGTSKRNRMVFGGKTQG